ncbi:hypothetical protein DIBBI_gp62 [Xanthomonas phage vB_XveM_DIBBI]|uniref:Uncharacterized protein n=1 Tax=Xanthomonas phage vB_XveM_DIBBI TaxID=1129194 RepID=I3PGZ5_9CAUD|nr:hypothetical protein DIBBI_gp62 [Xanthomonas phage vB_XveM_DIBBI]AEX65730.1 hypothetical protein DIBBI_062 [Xanthomonas phage vB_XveM_DIBBI]
MATPSRTTLFKKLALLQQSQDDLPGEAVELIFSSGGQDTGKHATEEALFRMALEIKILRLKRKLGYVQ